MNKSWNEKIIFLPKYFCFISDLFILLDWINNAILLNFQHVWNYVSTSVKKFPYLGRIRAITKETK